MRRLGAWTLHKPLSWAPHLGETWSASTADGRQGTLLLTESPMHSSALRRLSHPALLGVLEVRSAPIPHVVLEPVEGRRLSAHPTSLSLPDAISTLAALTDVLVMLHDSGLALGRLADAALWTEEGVRLIGVGAGQGAPESDVAELAAVTRSLLPAQLPDWLESLLSGMADPRPALRPTAVHILELLAAQGVEPPMWSSAWLQRRAGLIHVPQPTVTAAQMLWRRDGGALVLLGGEGSGRTHALDQIARQSLTRTEAVLRLGWSSIPWAPIIDGLTCPTLPGPPAAMPTLPEEDERAEEVARRLLARAPDGLVVIADDCDQLDSGTLATLAALDRQGARICASAQSAPPWARWVYRMPELSRELLAAMAERLVGPVDEAIVDALAEASDGRPGLVLPVLLSAIQDRAIFRYRGRWRLGHARLSVGSPPGLPPLAKRLAAFLALSAMPLTLPELTALVGIEKEECASTLTQLHAMGLVRSAGSRLYLNSHRLREQISDESAQRDIHHALAAHLLRTDPDSPALGWHLAGSGDEELIAAHGARCILILSRHNTSAGTRLAEALWAIAPAPALAGARLRAAVAAGDATTAAEFSAAIRPQGAVRAEQVPVLISLAHFHGELRDELDTALAYIASAREALGDAPTPDELLEIETQLRLKRGEPGEVLRLTAAISEQPPCEPERQELWLSLLRGRAQALGATGSLSEAVALLESVPDALLEGRVGRAELDATLGRLLWRVGRIRDAALVMERAANADGGMSAINRARLLNNAAIAWYMGGDLLSAVSSWESALLLFSRMDAGLERLRVLVNLCVGYRERMRWSDALRVGEEAVALARAQGRAEYEAMAAGNIGDLHVAMGNYTEARDWFVAAGILAEQHGLDSERVELARREAELAILKGEPDTLQKVSIALALAQQFDRPLELARCRAIRAVALARLGEPGEVEGLLESALSRLEEAGDEIDLAITRLWAAEAWRECGMLERAREVAERVHAQSRAQGNLNLTELSQRVLTRIRSQDGLGGAGERLARLMRHPDSTPHQDIELLLGDVAQAAQEALGATGAKVILFDGTRPVVAAARPRGDRQVPEAAQEVLATRMELVTDQEIALPLLDGAQLTGVLYVQLRARHSPPLGLARLVAAIASMTVVNARRLEEASRRARLAAEFTHDLRNPIHGIKLLVQLEQEEIRDDPDLIGSLENIAGLADRILSMVRAFLTDRGHELQPITASAMGQRLRAAVQASAWAAEIPLDFRCPAEVVMVVDADEIERVLVNLVDNAMRYSPPGAPISVSVTEEEGSICWRVRDRGPGIPAEALESIFDRGMRVDESREGYGLGLAIAQRITRAHGGDIIACNHPDGGAEFLVLLPSAQSSAQSSTTTD